MHVSPSFLTIASLATLVAGLFAHVIYQCFFSPLSVFPGPFAAKLTKTWRAYMTYRGQWHRDVVDMHRRYGPVVRIGPNELSVGDPEAFLQMYRASPALPKSASYSVVKGSRSFDLAGERNEKVHAAQRRLVARPYSMESVMHLEPHIDLLIKSLLGKLDDFAAASQEIDLGFWLQLFAFDIIGVVSFSKPFGFVSSGSDDGLFARLEQSLSSAAWLMHAGWLFRLHQKVMPLLGNWLAVNDRNGYFFDFAQREVQNRRDQGGNGNDIVGQLFKAQNTKTELNDLAISFMMTSNVFAGSDTTSIALRSIFLNLMRHPPVLNKLRVELQERRSLGRLGEIASYEEAKDCPYLQAVIYESMRVFSPVAFVLDRDVPVEGITIGGRHVPHSTVVGTSPWVIHLMPEVWGDNAGEFCPERWLDGDKSKTLRRFFFAFGGGTRTCIGRNISWLEIEKLVSTLLMRYDFRLADDANIRDSCGALVFIKGLRVQFSRREA